MPKVLTNMSGTYNAPDEVTLTTPLGARASCCRRFPRPPWGLCCVGRVGSYDGREMDHPPTDALPQRTPARPRPSSRRSSACLGHGGGHTTWHCRTCDRRCTGRRSTATARRWTGPRRCGCPRSEPRPLDLYGGGPTAVVDPGHATATPRARAGCSNCGAHPHAGPLVTATPPWPAVTAPTYIHEGRRPAARRCKQRNYMAQTEIRKATTDTSEGNPPAAEAG